MKKKTAKPKKRKIIVPKLALPIIPSQPEEIISSLKAMQETSVGWQIVVSIIKENIRLLDQQIIKKVDTEGTPLTDAEVDHFRDLRNINEEVMNTPEGYIKDLTRDEPDEEDDPDPFPRVEEKKD